MNQYRIKQIIGKICIGIVFSIILTVIAGFILATECSIIQTLGIVLGIALFILICNLAVNWGDL